MSSPEFSSQAEKRLAVRLAVKDQLEHRARQMRTARKQAEETGNWGTYYAPAPPPKHLSLVSNHNLPFDRWPISEG